MNHKGFTLVELMVSAMIAGILAAAITPMFLSAHKKLEEERTRVLAARSCNMIYELVERKLKTAQYEEIKNLLDNEFTEDGPGGLMDGENYDLEQDVRIRINEKEGEFLVLTVSIVSSEEEIIIERTGTVLALNLAWKENEDE